ncbi:ABC transporter ATP-binding protein [Candidatus Woesearchaeota archaeon]|nr:ABC transporter ATP-binding protein [Candidatus Woesearchaeota archaeon]
MADPLIQFKDISKRYGKHLILNNLNFTINEKDIYGIIGLSGSGKTTILNLMIGFIKPTQGTSSFKTKNVLKYQKEVQENFGFVTQAGSYYLNLSVMENLHYFGRMYGLNKDNIVKKSKELLSFLDLDDAKSKLANELSTGMQRRLDIACALIHEPTVLILDEPTEDLDPVLRKEILALLKRINDNGTTIVLTSHMLEEVESICNNIAILHNGNILVSGSSNKIKDLYSTNIEIHLKTFPGKYDIIERRLGKKDVTKVVNKGHKLVIYTSKPENILKKLLAILSRLKEKLIDIDVDKPSLEEVFESLTGRTK